MVKINLLKKVGKDADFETVSLNVSPIDLLLKFIFLILFVVPISYYENYNIDSLKKTNQKIKSSIQKISTSVNQKKENITEAEKVSKKIDQLESKEKILMDLAKKRSQLIKILDHFQNVMPDKLWFRKVSYDANTIRISGNSVDNENVSDFVRSLEVGDHLESVNLEKSFYSGRGSLGVLEFELTCYLKEG